MMMVTMMNVSSHPVGMEYLVIKFVLVFFSFFLFLVLCSLRHRPLLILLRCFLSFKSRSIPDRAEGCSSGVLYLTAVFFESH